VQINYLCGSCFFLLSHTRTLVRVCCKGVDARQWGNGKFEPLPRPNPLTDHHQKLHSLFRPCKIWSRSIKGFFSPYARNCASKIFTPLLFCPDTSNGLQPRLINHSSLVVSQTTRFRARMCTFGVRKYNFNMYTP